MSDHTARVSQTTYDALELDWTVPSDRRIKFGRGHQHLWDTDLADVTERILTERRIRRERLDNVTRMTVDRDVGRLLLELHDEREVAA